MNLLGFFLSTISLTSLLPNTSSYQEKMDEDKELKELGDNIKFYHRNLASKFTNFACRRREGRTKFTTNTGPFQFRSSTSKRFYPHMPIRNEYFFQSSPYDNRWLPIVHDPLWSEYGWADGFYFSANGAYNRHRLGHGGWLQNLPHFGCNQGTCRQWCCK